MNSVFFFYNKFSNQEFILKLNTLDYSRRLVFEKCILYKPLKSKKDVQILNNIENDIRYLLEFLTNIKIHKAINDNYNIKVILNKGKAYNLFLYFTYLIYSRSNFILESKIFESDFPILQKSNKINELIGKYSRNYFDIRFKHGMNLSFLSDNEYISWLSGNFFIRFIFKIFDNSNDTFFELKQYLFMSLIGLKFILIKKYKNKRV